MATPTLTSITPTAGHTGGRTLVNIVGTNFRLPPAPPTTGPTTAPLPSVRVTIGGAACPAVWVVSPTLIRAHTPIHDPSGSPASDVVVQNLDALGNPIAGESATLVHAFSFQRPTLSVTTAMSRAIGALVTELRRQVVDSVYLDPHAEYDPISGDVNNLSQLTTLPAIGLTYLRMPPAKDPGDLEPTEVDLGGGLFAVRRRPVVRDALLLCVGASNTTDELLTLDTVIRMFAQKNQTLYVLDPVSGATLGYALDYQRGQPVTFKDKSTAVEYFTSEFAIRRVVETDMPGVTTAGIPETAALGVHEATLEIGYTAQAINAQLQNKG